MSDSDEEIFWGPVTARELKIISHQLSSAENNATEAESKLETSHELHNKEKIINDCCTAEDWMQSENFHDEEAKKTANDGFNVLVQNIISSDFVGKIPEITISDCSDYEQNDTYTSTTITSATNGEHDVTNRTTDDGYVSVVVESFVQVNDSISMGSVIPLQSVTKPNEPRKSPLNSEVESFVASKNILSCTEEKHLCMKDRTFEHSRSDSCEVSVGNDFSSLGGFADGTCNSKYNMSNHQNTFITDDNSEDSCKSAHANISSSTFLTSSCSVNTHFSKSIESSLSNDCESMPFQFTMVSLDCTESQSPNDDCAVCERGASHCQDLASFANSGAFSNSHESILSNFISEVNTQSMSEKSNSNMITCISENRCELSNRNNCLSPAFKNTINDKSTNVHNIHADQGIVANEKCNSTPIRNITCSSKIPVLRKTPSSASSSSKKRGDNIKSKASECCENGNPSYFPNSHPFFIPESPVSYDINTDNLVTRSPNGNIIPTACNGSSVQTTTSISANYVHVMTSEKISELSRNGFFMESSPCTQDTSGRRQRSKSEDSETLLDIERENGSVLCSSSSTSSNSLNDTLDVVEMIMERDCDYMCNKDELSLNPNQEPQNKVLHTAVQNPISKQQPMQTVLKQCQYIRTSSEEPSPFHKEFKDVYADAARTPVLSTYTQKPASAVCPRQIQHLKKTSYFSNIQSPVGAYIKHRPVHLLKNLGKVKPFGKDDIPSKMCEKECIGPSAKHVPVKSVQTLPEVVYETAPGINVNSTKSTKKNYLMPTITKHAGRAVLATVPQNALQIIKNTEISVLYDKDVSKTTTL